MGFTSVKKQARLKRKKRIRKKIYGTLERPRLTVFRSNRHIYAQLVDDGSGNTLVSASSLDKAFREESDPGDKTQVAEKIGKTIASRAIDKGFKKVVFDRNGFLYHGRVKAVSEGARKGGLEF
ncbi:MAG TPA: 50S ribosomal protein L18 [Desulfobacterales bacterium]